MAFNTDSIITPRAFDSTSTDKEFTLAERVEASDGSEYVYVQANGALAVGDAVVVTTDGQATKVNTSNHRTGQIGFAAAAFSDDEYGWVQTKGATTVKAKTGALPEVPLYVTNQDGLLDDAGSANGGNRVFGVFLLDTATSSGAAESAVSTGPFV